MMFVRKLDFRDNQPVIVALKYVDLPAQALPGQPKPLFLYKPAFTQFKQYGSIL